MKKDRFYLILAILFFGFSLMFLTFGNYFAAFVNLLLGIIAIFKDIFQGKMSVRYWLKKKI